MTKLDIQNIVISKLAEKLVDSISIRERINDAFGLWFRNLTTPPPQPEPSPDEGEQK